MSSTHGSCINYPKIMHADKNLTLNRLYIMQERKFYFQCKHFHAKLSEKIAGKKEEHVIQSVTWVRLNITFH